MTITSIGQYQLTDMRDKIRRMIWGQYTQVDPSTGLEIGTTSYDQLISKTDLNDQINRSLTLMFLEINQINEDAYTTTITMSVKAGQTAVAFPPDMLLYKELRWKAPGNNNPQPYDYRPMPMIDEDDPGFFAGSPAPPWHRDGNLIIFDTTIYQDNTNGIKLRYVRWVPMLVNDYDVITGQMFRPLQECVIYKTAMEIQGTKRRNVTAEIQQGYATWHQALMIAASNLERPKNAQMYSSYMIGGGFTARRRRSRW